VLDQSTKVRSAIHSKQNPKYDRETSKYRKLPGAHATAAGRALQRDETLAGEGPRGAGAVIPRIAYSMINFS